MSVDGIAVRGSVAEEPGATGTSTQPIALREPLRHAHPSMHDHDGVDCTFDAATDPLTRAICPSPQQRLLKPSEGLRSAGRDLSYNDGWHGWPVRPLFQQHPIRGSFLDLRPMGNHFGIDINVRDARPESGAPRGRTHRVYAVEGGVAGNIRDGSAYGCGARRVEVGHFSYYHVDAVVAAGERVSPGQMIGWTCKGWWHVHLSEFTFSNGGRVLVNPLRRGGKLRPYVDSARPVVHAIRFYRPAAQIWPIFPGRVRTSAGS